MDSKELIEKVKQKDKWIRVLYMAFFFVVLCVIKPLFFVVVGVQFLSVLLTEVVNERLLKFSRSLSQYICEIYLFLGYNSEEKPFPFGEWPAETK